jgi:hypothetical protein
MASLKFTTVGDKVGWWTCGCGGTPKVMEFTKSESEVLFLNIPAFGETLTGISGAKYRVRAGTVALDIISEDAQSFVSAGKAQFATDSDRARYQGEKMKLA